MGKTDRTVKNTYLEYTIKSFTHDKTGSHYATYLIKIHSTSGTIEEARSSP